MQGFERMDRQLTDVAALAGHLIPAGSMFAFLAGHRAEVFPDADYADLFAPPGFGRPSVPATQMAAVMTLQALHDYSDREAAKAVRFDVRWKAAIGAALDDPGFDPSTLVYWRRRIAKSGRPHRVNDAVKKVAGQTGVLTGRRRRAVDSTILADAVATQDTVTQLVSAIRRVAREVPGAAGQIAAVCTGHDYSRPGKPKIDWDDPAAKDALVSALVNDADALVDVFKDAEPEEQAASALALLALVAGQDVEPAGGSDGTDGRWRIARKVAGDRVISAVDPDARHTRKSGEARRDGYRAHVAAEPQTGIITDEKLTKASGEDNSDPAAAAEFLAAEHASQDEHAGQGRAEPSGGTPGRQPLSWYADSAYGTGDLRDAIGQAGGRRGDQAQAAAARGRERVHPRRLHRQQGRTHRHLPEPDHPAHHRPPQRHLRSRLPRPPAAPPPRPAATSSCTNTTTCCAPPAATGPGYAGTTRNTGPTSSEPSPRSPPSAAAGSSSAIAEKPRTTPGSTTEPPH